MFKDNSVLPHDKAAEASVIGACLCDKRALNLALSQLKTEDFFVPLHARIFTQIERLYNKDGNVDSVLLDSVCAHDGIEGFEPSKTLESLLIDTPSAARIGSYCATVRNRADDRWVIGEGWRLIKAGVSGTGREFRPRPDHSQEPREALDVLHYNCENDTRSLLGDRFLCRGGGILIVGQSGIGKSSLTMQAAVSFAAGRDFFGIKPNGPLRSLIVQAENDEGDMAEQLRGVVKGMGLLNEGTDKPSCPSPHLKNLKFLHETVRTGAALAGRIADLAAALAPDLVWIDPLLSFIGGDICSQETCSKFLRNELNPVALKHNFGYMVVHHTGKPPRDQRMLESMHSANFGYLGIGSSELTNWARGVLTIRQVDGEAYELRGAKRGSRAGLTQIDGTRCEWPYITHLCHAKQGIFWERCTLNNSKAEKETPFELAQKVYTFLGADLAVLKDIIQAIQTVSGTKKTQAYAKFKSIEPFFVKGENGAYRIGPELCALAK